MTVQNIVVFLVVMGSGMYAAGTLMPSTWRRAMANQLLRLPVPVWLRSMLLRAAASGGGCNGCGGCDTAAVPKPSARAVPIEAPTQVIRFHPQRKA
jgi:hypothetical protein